MTVLLSDHLIQFVLLEGFLCDTFPKKSNIYERNFRDFNEREFNETINQIDWDSVLKVTEMDPNSSINNFHNNIIYLLDEFAPFHKMSKKELKLRSKPWMDNTILKKIKKNEIPY